MTKQEENRLTWYGKMVEYVNVEHLIECLRQVRLNRKANDSPYMDSALLNLIQLLEGNFIVNNPLLADSIAIGGCDACENKRKHQKCSCCRRNRYLKDNFKEGSKQSEF